MAAQPETAPPEDVQPETAPPETAKPEKKAKPGKGKPEEAKLEDAKPGKAKLVKVEEDAKPEEAKPEDAKPEKAAWRRSLPFQKRAFDQKPESLWQLPLTAKQGLAAATTQCISLAALCVAISYLSWVELEYRAHSDDRLVMRWAVSYTFGVPFSLHSAYWLNTSAEEFNPVAPNFWEQGNTQERKERGDLYKQRTWGAACQGGPRLWGERRGAVWQCSLGVRCNSLGHGLNLIPKARLSQGFPEGAFEPSK